MYPTYNHLYTPKNSHKTVQIQKLQISTALLRVPTINRHDQGGINTKQYITADTFSQNVAHTNNQTG